jgi:hypothetical protein
VINYLIRIWRQKRVVLAGVLLVVAAGCSSTNLGNIDETEDSRENMSGPGVLADEQGETPLKLKTGSDKTPVNAAPVSATALDEKAEFEQFKKWDDLRTNAPESAEYKEFLEWIKYQQFKAGQ